MYVYTCYVCMYYVYVRIYLFIYYVFSKKIKHIVQNHFDSKLWLSIFDEFESRDNTDLLFFFCH
jgi:hypothetical protein